MVDSERAVQRKRKEQLLRLEEWSRILDEVYPGGFVAVSYTHLRAHET